MIGGPVAGRGRFFRRVRGFAARRAIAGGAGYPRPRHPVMPPTVTLRALLRRFCGDVLITAGRPRGRGRRRACCGTWFDQYQGNGAVPGGGPASARRPVQMKVCVPVTADGQVDPRWGRAGRVAVAEADGEVRGWQEFTVAWGTLHDQGTEGAHHARVARFLRDNGIQAVGVHQCGPACSACSVRWRSGSLAVERRRPQRGPRGWVRPSPRRQSLSRLRLQWRPAAQPAYL